MMAGAVYERGPCFSCRYLDFQEKIDDETVKYCLFMPSPIRKTYMQLTVGCFQHSPKDNPK